jgi:UDP-glucose 4-epimerase
MLVTGGAGFIGSHLVDALVEHGDDVVVMDDFSGGFKRNVPTGVALCRGSVSREQDVSAAFADGPFDVVFHLAAYAAEGLSHHIKRFNYENNLVGSVNLINAAVNADVGHFVFLSSAAVYGHAAGTLTELDVPEPIDSYGIAKLAVEAELAVTERLFGLPYTIFRPHNVYGTRQNIADRFRNVIGIFINQVMHGRPLSIFGDGNQQREFSHVVDVVPALLAAPSTPDARNQCFNIGADSATSILDLAERVLAEFGRPDHPVVHLPARDEVVTIQLSHEKAVRVFDLPAPRTLAEGLAEMVSWAQTLGPQQPRWDPSIEIPRGLPPSWR